MNKNKKDSNISDSQDKQDRYMSDEFISEKISGFNINQQQRQNNIADQLYSPGYKHSDGQD